MERKSITRIIYIILILNVKLKSLLSATFKLWGRVLYPVAMLSPIHSETNIKPAYRYNWRIYNGCGSTRNSFIVLSILAR